MNISVSSSSQGVVGICGHAGVGHVHSHSGFVQDDSGGFAATAYLLKAALPVDTRVKSATADLEYRLYNGYNRGWRGGKGKRPPGNNSL